MVTNFIAKVAKMFRDFLGNFENNHFLSQTGVATFGKNLATFYSNIWSHCTSQSFQINFNALARLYFTNIEHPQFVAFLVQTILETSQKVEEVFLVVGKRGHGRR